MWHSGERLMASSATAHVRAARGIALVACAIALGAPAALADGVARGDTASTGDVVSGYRLFQAFSCGDCHSLHAAGPTAYGQLGMNFNRVHVPYQVAVAVITGGLPAGPPVFPTYMVGYRAAMTASQIRDLAAFVTRYSGGYKTCAVCTSTGS
jgi:hypothetical protein